MIFKRETIFETIKRKVEKSLTNDECRITSVELDSAEWSKFCKEYTNHHGKFSKKSISIRMLVPYDAHLLDMREDSSCSQASFNTHDVTVFCKSIGDSCGF